MERRHFRSTEQYEIRQLERVSQYFRGEKKQDRGINWGLGIRLEKDGSKKRSYMLISLY